MKKTILTVFSLVALSMSSNAQMLDEGVAQFKLYQGQTKLRERDFKKALEIFTEVYKEDSKNATAIYKMGECQLAMGETEAALDNFKRAVELDPVAHKDLSLSLGKAYHKLGEIDKALAEFNKYKESLAPKKLKDNEVLDYIRQCNYAKEFMSRPVNVKIENLGEAVNSIYEDYAPSITADGKTMIFTSRRPDTKGGGIDYEADSKYFEDVYMTVWNDQSRTWNTAEPIKGSLNTSGHDASLNISPDGHQILVYRNIPNETRSGDIYASTLSATGKWGAPHDFDSPVNSSYFESSACLSPDGNTIYFVSERKNGIGNGDIYKSTKINKKEWGEPVNLGPMINTIEDEISVFMHPDGKTLYFSSKGHSSMGGYDIFRSTLENGIWTTPVNMGYPINTVDDDLHFVLSTDNKTAFYSTILPNGIGERDIYRIDMSNYSFGQGAQVQSLSFLKGSVKEAGVPVDIEVSVFNSAGEKVFTSSTGESGNYFITLPTTGKYEVRITKDGYKPISEKFEFGAGGNVTLVKDFTLEKK